MHPRHSADSHADGLLSHHFVAMGSGGLVNTNKYEQLEWGRAGGMGTLS